MEKTTASRSGQFTSRKLQTDGPVSAVQEETDWNRIRTVQSISWQWTISNSMARGVRGVVIMKRT